MRFQTNSTFSPLAPISSSDPYGVSTSQYTVVFGTAAAGTNQTLVPNPPANNVNHIRWALIETGNSGPLPSPQQFIRIGFISGGHLIGFVTPVAAANNTGMCSFSDMDMYISTGLTIVNGGNLGSGTNATCVYRVEPIF